MQAKRSFVAGAGALAIGLGIATSAGAASGGEGQRTASDGRAATIELIERRGERLERAIDRHRVETLSNRYRELRSEARELGVAPRRSVLAGRGLPAPEQLEDAIAKLRKRIAEARSDRAASAEGGQPGASASGGLDGAEGGGSSVANGTLEAIAACESGGDPGAVNAAGYYGKYQFDLGTWQSVGGSGNPAAASEAEQDKRAAMLYERAGASPWPVCGQ